MSPQNLLQQLRGLNRYSPEFHDQLNNVLCVEKYKQLAQNLQDDDLVWLVDYLDEVRSRAILPRYPLSRRRSLIYLTLPVPLSGNVYPSLEIYVAP